MRVIFGFKKIMIRKINTTNLKDTLVPLSHIGVEKSVYDISLQNERIHKKQNSE